MYRIWGKKKTADKEGKMLDLIDQRCNNGREPINSVELIQDAIKALPINRRGTLEGVAFELGIGEMTIRRYIKQGHFKQVTLNVKPQLTQKNKKESALCTFVA